MTVTIKKTGPFALGGTDIRTFKEGDVHTLHSDHEQELIDAGHAEEGGDEDKTAPAPAGDARIADHLKVSQAPQAVDTTAVAARVVADGVTHDSEGGLTPGSTNNEGPDVTHAQDFINSETVKAGDEQKAEADEADAKAKADAAAAKKAEADKPKPHHAPAKHAAKPHGKK